MRRKNCSAVIAGRDTGKTSFLLRTVCRGMESGMPVMVIDSASEHREKSLLCKLRASHDHILLPSPPEEKLLETYGGEQLSKAYPLTEMRRADSSGGARLFLVDAAYYLEQGYETEDLEARARCRRIYRRYAAQAAWSFAVLAKAAEKPLLVMDEIELIECWQPLLPLLQERGCTVWCALHDLSGLDPCRDAFSLYTMEDYQLCPLSI